MGQCCSSNDHVTETHTTDSNVALQRLKDGNKRFQQDKTIKINIDENRRLDISPLQKPFAIILSCSDSRSPPEIIFNRGCGDLFVIRSAGPTIDDIILGTIEYAILVLKPCLLVVLGHTNCGAVNSAIEYKLNNTTKFPGNIQNIVDNIVPSVKKAVHSSKPDDINLHTIYFNIQNNIKKLRNSKIVENSILDNSMKIVSGVYNLNTGEVEFDM